ncbi:MAG: recombinase family protein [Candidatus Omnitrophica bacterium]|nr:recombinase family protein [Candidatus Omnitrophota bacterium]
MTLKTENKKKKRYVIYTRCSTDEQAQGDFTTLDAQAHHCQNMIDAFSYELADFGKTGIVNDDGYSGKDLNRPGIQSILENIQTKRSFDGIIFFRLDRLTRNTRDLYSMIDLFRQHDVDFISVRENLDSSTAIGRVVIGILGILSAFERELTGERVKASAIARVRQGYRIGGTTPIGYKLIPDGNPLPNGKQPRKAVIDEELAPHIKIIFEMAADNRSLTEIGQELLKRNVITKNKNIWRRQGLSTIIKCNFYKGYLKYNGETHKGKHEALVNEKLWEKANAVLSARLPGHSFTKAVQANVYLLSGLIRCGKCGSHMVNAHAAGREKNKFYYYECARSRQNLGCSAKRISAPGFDEAIIKYFNRAAENQNVIFSAIGSAILESKLKFEKIEATLNELQDKLDTLRHEADKLIQLVMDNAITAGPTYKNKLAGIEAEIGRTEEDIQKLQVHKRVAQMDASSGEFLHSNIKLALKYLNQSPPEAQKSLLQALIKDMTVYDDKIAINMYVEEALDKTLPKFIDQIPAQKEKNPTPILNQDEVLASTPSVSQGRPIWGLLMDKSRVCQPQRIQLVIAFHRRRYGKLEASLDQPLPEIKQPDPPINVINQSLWVKDFMAAHPDETCLSAASKLNIPRKRISKLLTIANQLPSNLITELANCNDPKTLRKMNVRELYTLAKKQHLITAS